jgi:hypothetical protein
MRAIERKDIEAKLREAGDTLYRTEKRLIDTRTHERTIVAHFASYLRALFDGWDVDTDYNREGNEERPKQDRDGLIIPDIIVHVGGSKSGPNLLAAQVKGYWNRESREKDEDDLRRLCAEYNYRFLYRLELGRDDLEIIPVT